MQDVGFTGYYVPAFRLIGLSSACVSFSLAGAFLSVTLARRAGLKEMS